MVPDREEGTSLERNSYRVEGRGNIVMTKLRELQFLLLRVFVLLIKYIFNNNFVIYTI